MNVWSVVVLVVGIITMAIGIIFKFIGDNYKRDLCDLGIDTKANTKRIEVLERQNDVILNELTHINRKLDELILAKVRVRSE
jgi:hypothetical protein